MRSIYLLCCVLACATARIPFMQYASQSSNTDPYDAFYYYGEPANNVFYPFQRRIVVNETVNAIQPIVHYNETVLHVHTQFLEIANEGEMVPIFSIPVNGTVMTVRLHANSCYPEQGGLYYRYNDTIGYGEQENEIVGTRATDEQGFLDFDIMRPWEMEVSNEQSVVITSAADGILLCMNLNWTRVDGAFSSVVGMMSLLSVLGLVMKQMFFLSV